MKNEKKKNYLLFIFLIFMLGISNFLWATIADEEWESFQNEQQKAWEEVIDETKSYNPYINTRFNFLVEIPTNSKILFAQNGDGIRWIDTENIFAGAWGANVILADNDSEWDEAFETVNFKNFLHSYQNKIRNHREELAYNIFKNNTYVISYLEGDKIIYEKVILTKEMTIIHLYFSYPKSKYKEMKEMVERASKSFRYLD